MEKITLRDPERDYRTKESYKTLRTNIEFSGEDNRVLVMTSCVPGEGKSTVSVALAESLAEDGKNVLLVDADLRKSVMAGRYHVTGDNRGLSHYLSGQAQLKDVVKRVEGTNMYMILAGVIPPNPAELLSGKRFENLLEESRKVFDYIIIDAPPLGSVIDAAVIAKNSDAAILVIAANTVSYRFAETIKDQLDKAGCPILGVILNKVDMKQNAYYGRYYGRYYGKYYGDYYGESSSNK